jgi:hypothetical protein
MDLPFRSVPNRELTLFEARLRSIQRRMTDPLRNSLGKPPLLTVVQVSPLTTSRLIMDRPRTCALRQRASCGPVWILEITMLKGKDCINYMFLVAK